jgi:hypothetical protein
VLFFQALIVSHACLLFQFCFHLPSLLQMMY